MKNIPQATLPLICQDGPTKTVFSFSGIYMGSVGGLVEAGNVWAFEKTYIDIVGHTSTSNPGIFFYDYTYNLSKGRIFWNYATNYFTVTRNAGGAAMFLGPTEGYFDKPMGFNGTAGVAKPTITGSRGGNAALASLLTALAATGLLTDSTTA